MRLFITVGMMIWEVLCKRALQSVAYPSLYLTTDGSSLMLAPEKETGQSIRIHNRKLYMSLNGTMYEIAVHNSTSAVYVRRKDTPAYLIRRTHTYEEDDGDIHKRYIPGQQNNTQYPPHSAYSQNTAPQYTRDGRQSQYSRDAPPQYPYAANQYNSNIRNTSDLESDTLPYGDSFDILIQEQGNKTIQLVRSTNGQCMKYSNNVFYFADCSRDPQHNANFKVIEYGFGVPRGSAPSTNTPDMPMTAPHARPPYTPPMSVPSWQSAPSTHMPSWNAPNWQRPDSDMPYTSMPHQHIPHMPYTSMPQDHPPYTPAWHTPGLDVPDMPPSYTPREHMPYSHIPPLPAEHVPNWNMPHLGMPDAQWPYMSTHLSMSHEHVSDTHDARLPRMPARNRKWTRRRNDNDNNNYRNDNDKSDTNNGADTGTNAHASNSDDSNNSDDSTNQARKPARHKTKNNQNRTRGVHQNKYTHGDNYRNNKIHTRPHRPTRHARNSTKPVPYYEKIKNKLDKLGSMLNTSNTLVNFSSNLPSYNRTVDSKKMMEDVENEILEELRLSQEPHSTPKKHKQKRSMPKRSYFTHQTPHEYQQETLDHARYQTKKTQSLHEKKNTHHKHGDRSEFHHFRIHSGADDVSQDSKSDDSTAETHRHILHNIHNVHHVHTPHRYNVKHRSIKRTLSPYHEFEEKIETKHRVPHSLHPAHSDVVHTAVIHDHVIHHNRAVHRHPGIQIDSAVMHMPHSLGIHSDVHPNMSGAVIPSAAQHPVEHAYTTVGSTSIPDTVPLESPVKSTMHIIPGPSALPVVHTLHTTEPMMHTGTVQGTDVHTGSVVSTTFSPQNNAPVIGSTVFTPHNDAMSLQSNNPFVLSTGLTSGSAPNNSWYNTPLTGGMQNKLASGINTGVSALSGMFAPPSMSSTLVNNTLNGADGTNTTGNTLNNPMNSTGTASLMNSGANTNTLFSNLSSASNNLLSKLGTKLNASTTISTPMIGPVSLSSPPISASASVPQSGSGMTDMLSSGNQNLNRLQSKNALLQAQAVNDEQPYDPLSASSLMSSISSFLGNTDGAANKTQDSAVTIQNNNDMNSIQNTPSPVVPSSTPSPLSFGSMIMPTSELVSPTVNKSYFPNMRNTNSVQNTLESSSNALSTRNDATGFGTTPSSLLSSSMNTLSNGLNFLGLPQSPLISSGLTQKNSTKSHTHTKQKKPSSSTVSSTQNTQSNSPSQPSAAQNSAQKQEGNIPAQNTITQTGTPHKEETSSTPQNSAQSKNNTAQNTQQGYDDFLKYLL